MQNDNEELKKDVPPNPSEAECGHGGCCGHAAGAEHTCANEKQDHCKGNGKKWKEEVERLQAEAASLKDKWMRSVAEFENFKKRNSDTRRLSYLEGRADVILSILPIGDNLERALSMCDENTKKGIEMVLKSFRQFLEGEGIEEINPLNEEFNPNFCEAIMSDPAPEGHEPGYVYQVFLKGYRRGDKILRYAQVKVLT